MAQGPVDELSDKALAAASRAMLVAHLEALYRRQDLFVDHEHMLRAATSRRAPEATQPPHQHPVPRCEDGVLVRMPLDQLVAVVVAVQRRLRDYLDIFLALRTAAGMNVRPALKHAGDPEWERHLERCRRYNADNRAAITARRRAERAAARSARAS